MFLTQYFILRKRYRDNEVLQEAENELREDKRPERMVDDINLARKTLRVNQAFSLAHTAVFALFLAGALLGFLDAYNKTRSANRYVLTKQRADVIWKNAEEYRVKYVEDHQYMLGGDQYPADYNAMLERRLEEEAASEKRVARELFKMSPDSLRALVKYHRKRELSQWWCVLLLISACWLYKRVMCDWLQDLTTPMRFVDILRHYMRNSVVGGICDEYSDVGYKRKRRRRRFYDALLRGDSPWHVYKMTKKTFDPYHFENKRKYRLKQWGG